MSRAAAGSLRCYNLSLSLLRGPCTIPWGSRPPHPGTDGVCSSPLHPADTREHLHAHTHARTHARTRTHESHTHTTQRARRAHLLGACERAAYAFLHCVGPDREVLTPSSHAIALPSMSPLACGGGALYTFHPLAPYCTGRSGMQRCSAAPAAILAPKGVAQRKSWCDIRRGSIIRRGCNCRSRRRPCEARPAVWRPVAAPYLSQRRERSMPGLAMLDAVRSR